MVEKYVFFHHIYGDHGCFSNWYHSPFEYGNNRFTSVEQFAFYHKASMAKRLDLCMQAESTCNPEMLLKLERASNPDIETDLWSKHKYTVIKRGVRAKFQQNKKLYDALEDTKDLTVVSCSPFDNDMSIGLAITDNRRFDRDQWKGKNMLGEILMQIRSEFASFGMLQYENACFRSFPQWEKRPVELMEKKPFLDAILTYSDMIENDELKEQFLYINTFSDTEQLLAHYKDGGLPRYGFTEMKQELFDLGRIIM